MRREQHIKSNRVVAADEALSRLERRHRPRFDSHAQWGASAL